MPSSPGTVSKILWHFTGGPTWNKKTNTQHKKPKSEAAAYAALTAILASKQLRVGKQERVELQAVAVAAYDRGREHLALNSTRSALVMSPPVCCLADIPIIHLGYHANRYGKFAIGFHRQRVSDAGFSPVFYQLKHSSTLGQLFSTLVTMNEFCTIDVGKILDMISEDPAIASRKGNSLARTIPFIQKQLSLIGDN